MKRHQIIRLIGVAAAALLVTGACSGESADTSGQTTTTLMELTGDPIKVGVIYTEGVAGLSVDGIIGGAELTASWVNAYGGINGAPLEVVGCNGMGEVETSERCAREFIDEDVVAVWGLSAQWGLNGTPLLESAGIVNQTWAIDPSELTSPVAFPFFGGIAAQIPGLVDYLIDEETPSVAIAFGDVPELRASVDLLATSVLEEAGVEVTEVPMAPGEADMSVPAAAVRSAEPTAVLVLTTQQECERFMAAAVQVGLDADVGSTSGCNAEGVLEAAGPLAESMFFGTDTLPPTAEDPDMTVLVELFEANDEPITSAGLLSYSYIRTIANLLTSMEVPIDRASVLEAVRTADGLPVVIAGTTDIASAPPLFPNLHNTAIRIIGIEGGEQVDLTGEWIQPWSSS